MSRLSAKFAELKQLKRTALIPFITAGDPNPDFTVPTLHGLVSAGADIIEIGVPFSDPMADGPVIQRASERALAHKMSLRRTLDLIQAFRRDDTETPVVIMGYLNPIEAMGYGNFVDRAAAAGLDGVLTVDMPPEESSGMLDLMEEAAIDPIFLLAPNSTDQRIRLMSDLGRGYLYYVALKGVTGAANLDLHSVEEKVRHIRTLSHLPIGVGFGVKNPEAARAIGGFADAVVIGSALVSKIEDSKSDLEAAREGIVALIAAMRSTLDAPRDKV